MCSSIQARPVNAATRQLLNHFTTPGGEIDDATVIDMAAQVEKLLLSRPRQELNENQFGSLVAFSLDQGIKTLETSTLLQRVNSRRYSECRPEFLKWNKRNGRELRILSRRRKSEANLFESLPNFIVRA